MKIGRELLHGEISGSILRCAIAVHTRLGPGLLESAYRACFAYELEKSGLRVQQEVPIPLCYENLQVTCAYRADLIVNDAVMVELKAVDQLKPIHEAQLLTYLKLTGLRVGLLLNFNAPTIPAGLRRLVL